MKTYLTLVIKDDKEGKFFTENYEKEMLELIVQMAMSAALYGRSKEIDSQFRLINFHQPKPTDNGGRPA